MSCSPTLPASNTRALFALPSSRHNYRSAAPFLAAGCVAVRGPSGCVRSVLCSCIRQPVKLRRPAKCTVRLPCTICFTAFPSTPTILCAPVPWKPRKQCVSLDSVGLDQTVLRSLCGIRKASPHASASVCCRQRRHQQRRLGECARQLLINDTLLGGAQRRTRSIHGRD